MKPGQADIKYLETAKRLDLYGLDLHPARDMENVEIYIGVGYSGIVIYRDRVRIGRFAWPKVLRISYKKSYFYLKIRPDYTEQEEAVVGFSLLNPQLAKRLWKTAVEHHAFFRLKGPRITKKGPLELLSGSSRFQYSGPGIRYDSIHSLNRTHPRDMTIGKAQSSDYLGPTKQSNYEPIRNVHSVNQPIITATRPPPPRPPVSARPPQPQPTNRRIQPQQVQQPISGQNYFENDGSLFDGASSRGEGSIIGSGFRGAEYEVPRQLSANDFSSYAQEQENLSIMSGDGADDINDPGVVSVSSVPWSASNSYNPRPSQESWIPSNPAPSVPSSASYLLHARDEQLHYVNVGDNNGYSETSSENQNAPTRPNRKFGPYVRQVSHDISG
ncbi:unnamed protein product [Hymenolepis diminuta]|uniref:FERM domain-containing protein n=1 Tax=Hymenolepis diminuta TaxID=6216 RepID=A0A0R3SUL4_HYMDI|nr:unnamed protein product [Hymenolepis diminuta]